ncbi:MAG: DUF6744 family protein [Oscillospiraceae bacterium]
MERQVNKIAMLEQKKQHYEEILRRELDGLDNEFETLRLLSQDRNCSCVQMAYDFGKRLDMDF